jgi:hypothetical protein
MWIKNKENRKDRKNNQHKTIISCVNLPVFFQDINQKQLIIIPSAENYQLEGNPRVISEIITISGRIK